MLCHWLVPTELADEVRVFLVQVQATTCTPCSAVVGVAPEKLAAPSRSSPGVDTAAQAALCMYT